MSSKAQIAAGQRRTIKSMLKRLEKMASDWGDVDNGNMWEIEDAIKRLKEASDNLVTEGEI